MNVKVNELEMVFTAAKEMSEETLSKALVHDIYRNTPELEDMHCALKPMSMEFFRTMKLMMKDKIAVHRSAYKLIDTNVSEAFFRATAAYDCDGPGMLSAYAFTLVTTATMFGNGWDKPTTVDPSEIDVLCRNIVNADPEDIDEIYAIFLLSGKFRDHCYKKTVLADSIMKEINIDIHNRMYSILIAMGDEFFN